MTTVGDAIKDALDSNWAGSGGAEPALYSSEDIGKEWPTDPDWIKVLGWTYRRRRKRRNDTFIGERYLIDLLAHSMNDANSEERLDTIVTEIYRIITPTNVTGFHLVDIVDESRAASDDYMHFMATLTVELTIKSTSSAVTPGSTTTPTEWLVDKLTFNNAGAGADPYLGSDSAAQVLGLTGSLTVSGTLTTATPAQIDDLLMFGSANAAYVPMTLFAAKEFSYIKGNSGWITSTGANNFIVEMTLPTPCNRGTLKLNISNLKFGIYDADAAAYITTVFIYGMNGNTRTQLDVDTTNRTAIGDRTFSGAVMPASAIDCSGYQSIIVQFISQHDAADEIDFGNVRMECYYAA